MNPFYQDNHNTIHCLDFRKNELPDECVQMVCTSPPYWSLRKYSGEQDLIWGGDDHCEHEWVDYKASLIHENRNFQKGTQEEVIAEGRELTHIHKYSKLRAGFCSLCGCWRGAYGLEPTPEMYVQHTIEILREIKRVLRKDGVVFWNIGDSYYSNPSNQQGHGFGKSGAGSRAAFENLGRQRRIQFGSVLKTKDMCLIPFRVALAAQGFATVSAREILQCADYLKDARHSQDWSLVEMVENLLRIWSQWAFLDGWWIRSVIIWSKPNPMPESVTDRPTESHEYILMLTKSGTTQYWTHRDGGGTRQRPKADYRWIKRNNIRGLKTKGLQELDGEEQHHGLDIDPQSQVVIEERDTPPEGWTPKNKMGWDRVNLWRGHDYYWDADAVREPYTEPLNRWGGDSKKLTDHLKDDSPYTSAHRERDMRPVPAGRNLRSVWTFATTPFPAAHFAVFPEKLPELCIKAATPEVGCCSKCGAPWERVVERPDMRQRPLRTVAKQDGQRIHSGFDGYPQSAGQEWQKWRDEHPNKTIGWQPTCTCNAPRVPSLVLDPLMGAGTTLWVAKKLNRFGCGYELSQEYCQLAVERCRQQVLGG